MFRGGFEMKIKCVDCGGNICQKLNNGKYICMRCMRTIEICRNCLKQKKIETKDWKYMKTYCLIYVTTIENSVNKNR